MKSQKSGKKKKEQTESQDPTETWAQFLASSCGKEIAKEIFSLKYKCIGTSPCYNDNKASIPRPRRSVGTQITAGKESKEQGARGDHNSYLQIHNNNKSLMNYVANLSTSQQNVHCFSGFMQSPVLLCPTFSQHISAGMCQHHNCQQTPEFAKHEVTYCQDEYYFDCSNCRSKSFCCGNLCKAATSVHSNRRRNTDLETETFFHPLKEQICSTQLHIGDKTKHRNLINKTKETVEKFLQSKRRESPKQTESIRKPMTAYENYKTEEVYEKRHLKEEKFCKLLSATESCFIHYIDELKRKLKSENKINKTNLKSKTQITLKVEDTIKFRQDKQQAMDAEKEHTLASPYSLKALEMLKKMKIHEYNSANRNNKANKTTVNMRHLEKLENYKFYLQKFAKETEIKKPIESFEAVLNDRTEIETEAFGKTKRPDETEREQANRKQKSFTKQISADLNLKVNKEQTNFPVNEKIFGRKSVSDDQQPIMEKSTESLKELLSRHRTKQQHKTNLKDVDKQQFQQKILKNLNNKTKQDLAYQNERIKDGTESENMNTRHTNPNKIKDRKSSIYGKAKHNIRKFANPFDESETLQKHDINHVFNRQKDCCEPGKIENENRMKSEILKEAKEQHQFPIESQKARIFKEDRSRNNLRKPFRHRESFEEFEDKKTTTNSSAEKEKRSMDIHNQSQLFSENLRESKFKAKQDRNDNKTLLYDNKSSKELKLAQSPMADTATERRLKKDHLLFDSYLTEIIKQIEAHKQEPYLKESPREKVLNKEKNSLYSQKFRHDHQSPKEIYSSNTSSSHRENTLLESLRERSLSEPQEPDQYYIESETENKEHLTDHLNEYTNIYDSKNSTESKELEYPTSDGSGAIELRQTHERGQYLDEVPIKYNKLPQYDQQTSEDLKASHCPIKDYLRERKLSESQDHCDHKSANKFQQASRPTPQSCSDRRFNGNDNRRAQNIHTDNSKEKRFCQLKDDHNETKKNILQNFAVKRDESVKRKSLRSLSDIYEFLKLAHQASATTQDEEHAQLESACNAEKEAFVYPEMSSKRMEGIAKTLKQTNEATDRNNHVRKLKTKEEKQKLYLPDIKNKESELLQELRKKPLHSFRASNRQIARRSIESPKKSVLETYRTSSIQKPAPVVSSKEERLIITKNHYDHKIILEEFKAEQERQQFYCGGMNIVNLEFLGILEASQTTRTPKPSSVGSPKHESLSKANNRSDHKTSSAEFLVKREEKGLHYCDFPGNDDEFLQQLTSEAFDSDETQNPIQPSAIEKAKQASFRSDYGRCDDEDFKTEKAEEKRDVFGLEANDPEVLRRYEKDMLDLSQSSSRQTDLLRSSRKATSNKTKDICLRNAEGEAQERLLHSYLKGDDTINEMQRNRLRIERNQNQPQPQLSKKETVSTPESRETPNRPFLEILKQTESENDKLPEQKSTVCELRHEDKPTVAFRSENQSFLNESNLKKYKNVLDQKHDDNLCIYTHRASQTENNFQTELKEQISKETFTIENDSKGEILALSQQTEAVVNHFKNFLKSFPQTDLEVGKCLHSVDKAAEELIGKLNSCKSLVGEDGLQNNLSHTFEDQTAQEVRFKDPETSSDSQLKVADKVEESYISLRPNKKTELQLGERKNSPPSDEKSCKTESNTSTLLDDLNRDLPTNDFIEQEMYQLKAQQEAKPCQALEIHQENQKCLDPPILRDELKNGQLSRPHDHYGLKPSKVSSTSEAQIIFDHDLIPLDGIFKPCYSLQSPTAESYNSAPNKTTADADDIQQESKSSITYNLEEEDLVHQMKSEQPERILTENNNTGHPNAVEQQQSIWQETEEQLANNCHVACECAKMPAFNQCLCMWDTYVQMMTNYYNGKSKQSNNF